MTTTHTATPAPDTAAVKAADQPLPKVLLVDDQPARLLTYESLLSGVGVQCTRAESGTQALERLLHDAFAVIVLDVNMPEMDGFETARRIREHPRFERTPIIFVTGVHITELDRLRGYEVGGIDYIPLPIVPEIFRSKIALLVELYKRRVELQTLNTQLESTRAQLEQERNHAVSISRALQDQARLQQAPEQPGARDRLPLPLAGADRQWLSALLQNLSDEVYFTDASGRYLYASPAVFREFGHGCVEGREVREIVATLEVFRADGTLLPVDEAPSLRALRGEVISDEPQTVRNPRTGDLRHRLVNASPVHNVAGEIIGSIVVVRDMTYRTRVSHERIQHEKRSAALLRLTDRFRVLTDPADLAYAAAEILGETLQVSRCGYGTIDGEAETITIERGWNAAGVHSLPGVLHFREYGTYIDELKRGETVVCVDAVTDSRTAATAQALRSIQVQSFVNMPIIESQGTVALLYLSHVEARAWSEEELAFIRDAAERTRVAVERRRNEQALAADLESMGRLRDLSARLVAEDDQQVLFDEILHTAMLIARSDGGTIQVLDPETGDLLLAASRGMEAELVARFGRVSSTSYSSCGQALTTAQRVYLGFDTSDGDDFDGTRAIHRACGLSCAQSTPLMTRSGRVLGMFSTHWKHRRVLREREHRFLDLLALQAADLLERQEHQRAARESSRRKDEFIALLSHELRNPLVPIRNGIKLLETSALQGGIVGQVQPMMARQMSHMVRLMDDLLDVSRVTSGRLELNKATTSLNAIVTSAVDSHREQLAIGRIQFDLRIDASHQQIHVDGTRLAQALSNLLSNAIKFTPPDGRISVVASLHGKTATDPVSLSIQVRDTGAGIAPERLPHIFELFGSIPSSVSDRSLRSGLGVGLALARKIVELHGGKLHASSGGIGQGTEFVIRIPVPAV